MFLSHLIRGLLFRLYRSGLFSFINSRFLCSGPGSRVCVPPRPDFIDLLSVLYLCHVVTLQLSTLHRVLFFPGLNLTPLASGLALEFSPWHLSIAILHYKFSLLNFFEALYQCWNNSFMWSLATACVSTKLICMKARSMPFCLWLHPRGRPWCLAHGSH